MVGVNNSTKFQKGSPIRDSFMYWRKQMMPSTHWASDVDTVLVAKNPYRELAVYDYKRNGDSVTFSEACIYLSYINRKIPVFLVWLLSDVNNFIDGKKPSAHRFKIERVVKIDPKPEPPVYETENMGEGDWGDWAKWEADQFFRK